MRIYRKTDICISAEQRILLDKGDLLTKAVTWFRRCFHHPRPILAAHNNGAIQRTARKRHQISNQAEQWRKEFIYSLSQKTIFQNELKELILFLTLVYKNIFEWWVLRIKVLFSRNYYNKLSIHLFILRSTVEFINAKKKKVT